MATLSGLHELFVEDVLFVGWLLWRIYLFLHDCIKLWMNHLIEIEGLLSPLE